MKHLTSYLAAAALAPVVLGAQSSADLVLTNGHIYTVDNARPVVSALAVRGGRIIFVGSDAEARALSGPSTTVVDLHGATVVPGFTDAQARGAGAVPEHERHQDDGVMRCGSGTPCRSQIDT